MTRRGEAGVTLVELLVVVAITGLVVPVLTSALVLGWRTTDSTVNSLADSRNRQLVPSLFTRDVQTATLVDTDTSLSTCTQAGDTLVVRMRWTQTPATGSPVDHAAAWVTTTSGGLTLLQRRSCDTSSGVMTVLSSVAVAHGLVGAPAVTCRSATGAVTACSSAVRVELTAADASGVLTATGRRRAA